ncbi:MAG: hypothetical protein H6922_02275 [Pseudomonadaceae bacterium]|nr:hypothetical protein [Pseudomonadaceae bacterium]
MNEYVETLKRLKTLYNVVKEFSVNALQKNIFASALKELKRQLTNGEHLRQALTISHQALEDARSNLNKMQQTLETSRELERRAPLTPEEHQAIQKLQQEVEEQEKRVQWMQEAYGELEGDIQEREKDDEQRRIQDMAGTNAPSEEPEQTLVEDQRWREKQSWLVRLFKRRESLPTKNTYRAPTEMEKFIHGGSGGGEVKVSAYARRTGDVRAHTRTKGDGDPTNNLSYRKKA